MSAKVSAGVAPEDAPDGMAGEAVEASAEAAAEFAAAFRAGVAGLGGVDAVRDGLDKPAVSRAAHRDMMDELGLGALLVSEEHDGLGEPLTTAVAIGREAGRVPAADLVGPYVMAPVLLQKLAGGSPAAAGLLGQIAAGETRVTVAVDGLVFDAESADAVLVYAGGELRLVAAADLETEELPAFDPTRSVRRIVGGAPVGGDAAGARGGHHDAHNGNVLASGATASATWATALTAGRIYLAAELEGTARAMLEATVSYLSQRIEFGRPLGSFQALKHQLAEMWSELSLIGPLVDRAVAEFDAGSASTARPGLPAVGDHGLAGRGSGHSELYAAAALSFAGDTAAATCERGLQLHGGIGYTWESSVHVWLKRAAANRVRLGTPHGLRARVAELADI